MHSRQEEQIRTCIVLVLVLGAREQSKSRKAAHYAHVNNENSSETRLPTVWSLVQVQAAINKIPEHKI